MQKGKIYRVTTSIWRRIRLYCACSPARQQGLVYLTELNPAWLENPARDERGNTLTNMGAHLPNLASCERNTKVLTNMGARPSLARRAGGLFLKISADEKWICVREGARQFSPTNVDPFLYGACLLASGKISDSVSYLEEALREHPSSELARQLLVSALESSGMHERAAQVRAGD